jgi:hypothetical protein
MTKRKKNMKRIIKIPKIIHHKTIGWRFDKNYKNLLEMLYSPNTKHSFMS